MIASPPEHTFVRASATTSERRAPGPSVTGELLIRDWRVAFRAAAAGARGSAEEVALRAPLGPEISPLTSGADVDRHRSTCSPRWQLRRPGRPVVAPAVAGLAASIRAIPASTIRGNRRPAHRAGNRYAIVTRRDLSAHRAGRSHLRGLALQRPGGAAAPGIAQRRRDQSNIARVQARQHRAEIDRSTRGQARGDPQHLLLAGRAKKPAGVRRRQRCFPIDQRHHAVAGQPGDRLHEPSYEIVTHQPAAMADQQLGCRLGAEQALGVPAQRCWEVLDTGSESGLRSTKSRTRLLWTGSGNESETSAC